MTTKNTKYYTRRFIMLSFLKKIFGAAEPEVTAAPYKVETPATPAAKPVKTPTVKKATTAKPRKPRAPKA
jgi:hypothetical protein